MWLNNSMVEPGDFVRLKSSLFDEIDPLIIYHGRTSRLTMVQRSDIFILLSVDDRFGYLGSIVSLEDVGRVFLDLIELVNVAQEEECLR